MNPGKKQYSKLHLQQSIRKQNRFDLYNGFDAISVKAFFATLQKSIADTQ